MKISPKSVTIFVDDFAHIFSPKLVKSFVESMKFSKTLSPKFVTILMIC